MPKPLIAVSRRHALLFAAFLVLYEFLTYIANDMIMPGMLQVVDYFRAPESAIATSLTVYILGGASLQLFLGPISDRFGRRPVMLVGAFGFLVFTFLIALSQSIGQFLLARYFQGMGLCFIGVIGYATLQEIFDEMDAIRLVAIISNVALLAPLLGPLAGAAAIQVMTWRDIFICIGALAVIAFLGLWRFMPEPVGARTRTGKVIPRVSLSPRTIAANYRQLLTDRSFVAGSLATGVLAIPCIVWIGLSPVMIIREANLSMMVYALWQLPVFSALIVGNFVLHHLSHRFNLRTLVLAGSAIAITGLVLGVALPYLVSPYFVWFMPGLTLYSLGLGITSAPLNRHVLFSTRVSKGTASAVVSLFVMALQAIGMESANIVYRSHSNRLLAVFCVLMGLLYCLCLLAVRFEIPDKAPEPAA